MATGDKVYLRIQTRGTALATGEPRTKPIYNVWDFKRTSTGGTPLKSSALTAFKSTIQTPLLNCLSVSYIGGFCDVRWLDDPVDPYATTANAVTGAVTLDSSPSLNNVFAKMTAGLRGRNNRGGKHFGPIAESSTLLDQINAGEITLFGTLITAWLTGFTAGDGFVYTPFIVSARKSTFNSSTANVVGVTCTAVTVNPVIGRMTRRAQFRRGTV